MTTWIVTGGLGFIGANFIRHLRHHRPHDPVINIDLLTYSGNLANLPPEVTAAHYTHLRADIADRAAMDRALEGYAGAMLIHFAAESHVDRSILGADVFVRTNVQGTLVLLDMARKHGLRRFVQVSTDEVYGSLGPEGRFTETTPLAPNSPYSASKAGADMLVRAYHETFGQDTVITRCSNNYGPLQFPEKLIPLMILRALRGEPLPVYGDGQNVRDWLHVEDHCAALLLAAEHGRPGAVYNIGGDAERPNIWIVRAILDLLGKPHTLIQFVADRPGHDRRYAMDHALLTRELGWQPRVRLEDGLAATVAWYQQNRAWWEPILSGEYRNYISQQYGHLG